MINQLKATNISLGFVRNTEAPGRADSPHQRNSIGNEIGETKKMFSYVQQRDFSSSVLPSKANAIKPLHAHLPVDQKSTNQSTFKQYNFKMAV